MQPAVIRFENGKIRIPTIQITIIHQCMNSCACCASFAPLMPKRTFNIQELQRDLYAVAEHIYADRIHVFGGEPLLHPDLCNVLRTVRESGIAHEVSITTNGQAFTALNEECWAYLDSLQVTSYLGKLSMENMCAIKSECDRRGKGCSFLRHSFAKIVTKNTNSNDKTREIWTKCDPGGMCVLIADGRLYWCVQMYYLKQMGFSIDDGVEIKNATRESIIKTLTPSNPSNACYRCTGLLQRTVTWHETFVRTPTERDAWLKEATDVDNAS